MERAMEQQTTKKMPPAWLDDAKRIGEAFLREAEREKLQINQRGTTSEAMETKTK